MSDQWHWEERPAPFPARRLVVAPGYRERLIRFMDYETCPSGHGNEKAHRYVQCTHVIDSQTGKPMCMTDELLNHRGRSTSFNVITSKDQIPSGEWEVLGVWDYV